jgi:hypothetical protein
MFTADVKINAKANNTRGSYPEIAKGKSDTTSYPGNDITGLIE